MNSLERLKRDKKIIKAAVYARFSSDNQRDESIDAQLRAIRDYAVKNDMVIVEEFVDKAKSATTDNRPEFLRMIKESAKKKFDVVLVHKLDRVARNRQDSIGYRMELKRHGVSLISVLEYLDDGSPESVILESVLEAMAEYYSLNLAREVNKGMKENALKGLHTGGVPPLGYDVDPDTKKLVINEKEAESVRLIFQGVANGDGYGKISVRLNDLGYKTKKGNYFSLSSIHDILINEKYKGIYIFNKSSSKDVDGKRNSHSYKDESEMIKIEGGIPAIINDELFEYVQKRMKENRRSHGNHAIERYLLTGNIFCGRCKSTFNGARSFSGRNKIKLVVYECNSRHRTNSLKCNMKAIRREYVESYVLEKLAETVFDNRLIPHVVKEYNRFVKEKNVNISEKIKELEKQLHGNARKITRIIDLLTESDSNTLIEKLDSLESEKKIIADKLNKLRDDSSAFGIKSRDVTTIFKKCKEMCKDGTLPNIKNLLDIYVDKIIVNEEDVNVYFNIHPYISKYYGVETINNNKSREVS